MHHIEKIHLMNFRGFEKFKLEDLHAGLNILVGDNDVGKSSILQAIDLALSASTSRIESIGLDRLLNNRAVEKFLASADRTLSSLPKLQVDIYFSGMSQFEFQGEYNAENQNAYGICLECLPKEDLIDEINDLLARADIAFPFEYYSASFKTFSGKTVSSYRRPLEHLNIDNTKISNDAASRSYVRAMYKANTTLQEQNELKHAYRGHKLTYAKDKFGTLNAKLETELEFSLRHSVSSNLETDLTVTSKGVDIENMGVGSQCFVRTQFALSKKSNIDVALLEEPENHLSHSRMKLLIEQVRQRAHTQLFVTTHSSMVCSRLGLERAILISGHEVPPIKLSSLSQDTADFFMKAPSNALLQFVLSEKNLLVEGDAEYILMAPFFKNIAGKSLEESQVNVVSIGGLSFKRYLEIARLLKIRTAVITDNDKDPNYCKERYSEFADDENIRVFFDEDAERHTFEVCVYRDNPTVCDNLFGSPRRTLSTEEYMLKNKSSAAFELSKMAPEKLNVPAYVREAIQWAGN